MVPEKVLVSVTAAPTIAAPEESSTEPEMVAFEVCATAVQGSSTEVAMMSNSQMGKVRDIKNSPQLPDCAGSKRGPGILRSRIARSFTFRQITADHGRL
jgi:hypothetical protein